MVLAAGSPASRTWNRLAQTDGLGRVSAIKLLARKLAQGDPVNDRVVRCALGAPTATWLWLNDRFVEDDGAPAPPTSGAAPCTSADYLDQASTHLAAAHRDAQAFHEALTHLADNSGDGEEGDRAPPPSGDRQDTVG